MSFELKYWKEAVTEIKKDENIILDEKYKLACNAIMNELVVLHQRIEEEFFFSQTPLKSFMDNITQQFHELSERISNLEKKIPRDNP